MGTETLHIVQAAEAAKKQLGWNLVGFKPYSTHSGDRYLYIALLDQGNGKYTTHGYNSQFKSFFDGHYFITLYTEDNFKSAMKDFRKRNRAKN